MQVTETLSDGLKREIEIVIPGTDLNEKTEAQLNDLKARAQIRGFRPGKVPIAHLRKLYGTGIKADIVNTSVSEAMQKAFDDRDEVPALQPDINIDEENVKSVVEGDADLSFKVSYDIIPKFELADFSTFKIERPVYDVPDEEIEEELKKLGDRSRNYEAREEGSAAEDGDRVMMSYVGKIDGEAFDGGADENGALVLGSGQFIPGFEEQLVGARQGEDCQVTVSFPEDYPAAELAGKKAVFDVHVKEVAAPHDIAIDDEFAKTMGLDDLGKLKDAIRGEVESNYGGMTRNKVKRQLLDQMEEAHDFDLPPSLAESEFDTLWRQLEGDMERRQATFEAEGKSEEEMREEFRNIANRRVRLGLVLSEIGSNNEIQVTDDEMSRAMYQQAIQNPQQAKDIIEYYQNTPQAMASLRAPIYEEKVVDYLLELVEITDKSVSKEELMNDPDDDHDHDHHDHDH